MMNINFRPESCSRNEAGTGLISMKTAAKMLVMNRDRLKLFHKENESWKRLLEFIQAENCYLKARIADIVNQEISEDMLAEAENFQHRFIRKDEMIALARKDIRDFDGWIARQTTGDGTILKEALQMQTKLRTEMEKLEQRFNVLKSEFNNYISENL